MPTDATPFPGGFSLRMVLDEQHFEPLARLTHDVLQGALLSYASLAAPGGLPRG
jgi:hypothetical protein